MMEIWVYNINNETGELDAGMRRQKEITGETKQKKHVRARDRPKDAADN
jgi:hypothetical protein